ncbi:MAG TPA: glycosyltransferase family 1 protein [Candidatus Eremiobacteraceae bacterium]|nr:glycosyltransferase family 1 protein [Candidatus Eremiobacteraceae bacterium]
MPDLFPRLVEPRLRDATGVADISAIRQADARKFGVQLVWYPWNGMTWTTTLPSVVTVHDLWPFVSPADEQRKRDREQSHYLRAVESATRFIAVSRFTADEMVERLKIDRARIDVIPHGVARLTIDDVAPARLPSGDRYVLFVGETEARKDVATLARAAALLPQSLRSSIVFVVAGKKQRTMADVFATPGVRFDILGEVSDGRLASLFAGASAFVFPSRYEGFGLPVLEAMSYGVPVIASDAPAVKEAAGDAALIFTAGDAAALASALERALTDVDLSRRLSEAGRARAASMTVDLCAERTLEAFGRALAA